MIVEKCKAIIKCDANGCKLTADKSVSFDGLSPQYHFCSYHAKALGKALRLADEEGCENCKDCQKAGVRVNASAKK